MSGPLSHVRVLDLSRILAGPWTGQLLADLGADVIKVERPDVGDDTRTWGPPFLRDGQGFDTRESGYFLAVNRGKRSITADLDSPEGQRIVTALAEKSDILLENFKVGTLAKFKLGYEDLKSLNPRLIYCSLTGFGQTGPKRQNAAYDFMIQAMGGLMSITGQRDEAPGGGPQKVGVPIVDIMSGMYAAVAVLAASARREQTGTGDYIDLAMLDVMVATLANQANNYLLTGRNPKRTGNAHPNIQPQDVFATGDGHIALAIGNDGQFAKLAQILGQPELSTDERFATNAARVRHSTTLTPLLQDLLRTRDTRAWVSLFEPAGIPCGPINSIADVFTEPQVVERQMLIEAAHPISGSVRMISSPMRFQEAPLRLDKAPPTLGQHREEILREFGLLEEDEGSVASEGASASLKQGSNARRTR